MALKVDDTLLQRLKVFLGELVLGNASVVLLRADRRHNHRAGHVQVTKPGLDIHKLLAAKIRAEAGFRQHDISELQGGLRRQQGVAAVRDIGEGTTVHECGNPAEGLHEVRVQGIAHQCGQRTFRIELARGYWALVIGKADGNIA